MQRRVGIVAGALAALAVAGAAGLTTVALSGERPRQVGRWHEAPAPTREVGTWQQPSQPQPAQQPKRPESGQVTISNPAGAGREQVGTLQQTHTIIGYAGSSRRETFHYPQASYVKLHFDRMALLPGDYITVSDGAGRESYRYAAPAPIAPLVAGPIRPADRWAMSVDGDTAVLELHRVAAGLAVLAGAADQLGVGVDRVARGYTPVERIAAQRTSAGRPAPIPPGSSGREESVCGSSQSVDAVCYRSADPVVWIRSQAVARLLINGTELCTGWRVGAKNRVLTNNHCLADSADAYQTEVWFNYRCTVCGGSNVLTVTKVWGDKVLATNHVYDFTLFTLDRFDLVQKFGFLRLDTRRPIRGEELYLPQHPAGRPTKVSGARGTRAGNCAVVDSAYDGYIPDSDVSYYCDTEGGSSGSPVLSRATDKVVALHHFGGCPNSGVRADLIYSKIKKLI